MQIAPLTPHHIPQIRALQPPDWGDIIPAFVFYLASPICAPIGVQVADRLVGVGCVIRFPRSAWIGHIIVDPAHRRRGIATTIVRALLDHVQDDQLVSVSLVATASGYPVYRRFGFADAGLYSFYEIDGAFSGARPTLATVAPEAGDHDRLSAFDAAVVGEDRLHLLQPHLSEARVVKTDGAIVGVWYPRLGEGLVEAVDPAVGVALLALRLRGASRCVVPSANRAANTFLIQNGFHKVRDGFRMTLGPQPAWRPELVYSRVGGNLG